MFNLFNESELKDLSQMNEYDNHIEHIDLEEEQLYLRMSDKPKSIEELTIEKLKLKNLWQK